MEEQVRDRSKDLRELAAIERELLDTLRRLLPQQAAGRCSTLFMNSRDSPQLGGFPEAEALLELATAAARIREQCGLPLDEGPGAMYMKASREANDERNEHRLGPKRQAERLLADLKVFGG